MALGEYNIEQELQPGEKLLWKGKPATGIRFQPSDAFHIPFSIFFTGFAVFWICMAAGGVSHGRNAPGAMSVFPLFGLPFLCAGLYMMIGRFFVDARIRANTDYALTNQRAIIASGISARKIKTLNLKSIADVSLSERPDGSGTITFNESQVPQGYMYASRGNFPGVANNMVPSFQMIDHVRDVYALIGKVQRGEP